MGNFLNAGNKSKGGAYGFKLDLLKKLKNTKSISGKTTLMHYLVKVCEEKYPNYVKIDESLAAIPKASKVVSAFHSVAALVFSLFLSFSCFMKSTCNM